MYEGPNAHQIADWQAEAVPMDEDARALANHLANGVGNDVALLGDGAPVLKLPAYAGQLLTTPVPSIAGIVMEQATRMIPIGRPLLKIAEMSHEEILALTRKSTASLAAASNLERVIPWFAVGLSALAVVFIVLVVLSVLCKSESSDD